MVVTNVMLSMIIILISFIAGFAIYYIFTEEDHREKMKTLEDISSVLINFVLFIWLSKVILNFPAFISEPLTILAYPGSAETFYLAFIFSSVLFMYQHKRRKADRGGFIKAFTMVFLLSSMVYELIQFLWNNDDGSFGYLLLLSGLLIIFLVLEKRTGLRMLTLLLITLWSGGMMLLILLYPVVTVFGYIMQPGFIALFFAISSLIIFITVGKEGRI
ncbi:hypothetical protein [Salinicoccus sp. RF5]|uniref:hypothetical protein n=1 Tax=Salinicoccus sp. RF5 TaxID=2748874 RepID=UPI001E625EBF|nr:hypothetical protein [Salinicoccus sp. RF5]MCC4723565.1 hypothetical protein [Salinicoccus sp. RF5]